MRRAFAGHNGQRLFELQQARGQLRFARAYAFSSPSAAAEVLQGRAANGTLEWKTPEGKTYKEWEAETLSVLPQEDA